MSYGGHIENGAVVLDDPIDLPDGTRVKVEEVEDKDLEGIHPELREFIGIIPQQVDAKEEYYKYLEEKYR